MFTNPLKSYILILKLWFLCLLCIQSVSVFAQIYPVQLNTLQTPPFNGHIPDYSTPGNANLKLLVLFTDFTKPAYQIKLKIAISGQGIDIKSKSYYYSQPFTITPGIPTEISGSDLAGLLSPINLDISGISPQHYQTKVLPEGFYNICFTAYDYINPIPIQVSNQSCANGYMVLSEVPFLNLPMCESTVPANTPQNVMFQWTPMNFGSPNSFNTVYDFELYEVRPGTQNPGNIIQTLPPIYQTTIYAPYTQVNYGITEPQLYYGMQYVWRVRARDQSGLDLYKNQGYSQQCTFTYGSVLSQIDSNSLKLNLQAQALTYRAGKCTWDSLGIFVSYRLEYRKQGYTNWFVINTTKQKSNINNLEPENTYEARVKGIFSEGSGPWSNIVTFTTPPQVEIQCGQASVPPSMANFVPLTTGSVGQVWNIGAFDMVVVQLDNPNSANGVYSGYGNVIIPFLGNMKVMSKFTNITMNEAMQMMPGGVVEAVSEGQTGGHIINLDTLFAGIGNAIDNIIAKLNSNSLDSASLADFNNSMTTLLASDSALSSLQATYDSLYQRLLDISTTAGLEGPNYVAIQDLTNELEKLKNEMLLIKTNPDYFGQAIIRPDERKNYIHTDAICIQDANDKTIAFILPSGETFFWIDNGTVKGYFLESGYTYHDSYQFYVEDKYNRQTEPISWGIYLAAYDLGGGALTFIESPVGTITRMANGVKKIVTLQFDISKTWDRVCNADLTDVSYVTATFALAYLSGPKGKVVVTEAETPALLETMETFITKVRPTKLTWTQVLAFFRDGKLFGDRITNLINVGNTAYLTELAQKVGITFQELQTYTKIEQLQINIANNAYVVLDNAFVKKIYNVDGSFKHFEIIANESKLSATTTMSKRQTQFLNELDTKQFFTSRSVNKPYILQNSIVKIKSFVKTAGDGTINGNYTITKLK